MRAVLFTLQVQEGTSIELEVHLRTSTVAMQHSIVRRTHFVIKLVNYTYSKLVELWPMTLAPTIEHQVEHGGKP